MLVVYSVYYVFHSIVYCLLIVEQVKALIVIVSICRTMQILVKDKHLSFLRAHQFQLYMIVMNPILKYSGLSVGL